jgi:outer membrane protein insertion porin family
MAGVCSRRIPAFTAAILMAVWVIDATPRAAAQSFPAPAEEVAPPIGIPDAVPEQELVVDVRVEGNRTVSQAKIFQQIETRIGRPFKKNVVERDVKQLASRGWFLDVRPLTQQVLGGRVVIFRVTERPTLRYVEYLGNENIRDKPLTKETGLKVGDSVDPYAVEEGRRRIIQYYQDRGFNKVQVEIKEGINPNDSGAVFIINEGPRQRVSSVAFIGNTIASDSRLKTQIQSKPGILWLFKGYVNRKKIDEDVDRLTAYYRSLGFFRARIGRELDFSPSGWLSLTFVIDEGPRFKVRSVSFVGNKDFRSEDLAKDMQMTSGEFFNQDKMNADLGTLRDIYGSFGYVFADIKASPRTLEGQPELDLVYDVEEGSRYRVGRIRVHITGDNPHTRTKAVLNRVSMRTGDIMDIREMRNSERRLRASSIFNTDPTTGDAPKILFSPPEKEEGGPGEGGQRFRGQSPDPEPADSSQSKLRIVPSRSSDAGAVDFDIYANDLNYSAEELAYYARNPRGTVQLIDRMHPVRHANSRMQVRAQSPGVNVNAGAYAPPASNYGGYGQLDAGPGGAPAVVASHPVTTAQYAPPAQYNGQAQQYAAPQQPYASAQAQYTQPAGAPQNYNPNAQPYAAAPANNGAANRVGVFDGQGSYDLSGSVGGQQAYGAQPGGPAYNGAGPAVAYNQAAGAVPNQVAYLPSGADGQYPPVFTQPYDPTPFYEPTPPSPYQPMPILPVDVVVQETQTGRFMLGVGVNSNAGVVGSITIDERNFDWRRLPTSWEDFRSGQAFRGAGQRFRVEMMPGTQVQRYMISFQDPYLLDTPISLSLSGFFFNRNYLEWNEQRLGGRVGLGYQLTPDLSTTLSYRGENVNISNPIAGAPPQITNVVGDNILHGFKLSAAHDTRDSAFLATEGHYIQLSGEQVIGTYEYARGEIEAKQYFMLYQRPDGSGRHVMSLTGQAGFSGVDTPVYDNWFAGGFNTFRGFAFRGASPRVNGVTVGGRFMMLGSAEYLFPITANDMLRGVVFTDFGTVEPDVQIKQFRVAPGVGLRVTVPALGPAPIALDFAVPVLKQDGDRTQVFSFNIGFMR